MLHFKDCLMLSLSVLIRSLREISFLLHVHQFAVWVYQLLNLILPRITVLLVPFFTPKVKWSLPRWLFERFRPLLFWTLTTEPFLRFYFANNFDKLWDLASYRCNLGWAGPVALWILYLIVGTSICFRMIAVSWGDGLFSSGEKCFANLFVCSLAIARVDSLPLWTSFSAMAFLTMLLCPCCSVM